MLHRSLFPHQTVVIGGISAWYIFNKRHPGFFSKSLKIVLAIAIAVAPLQIAIGHVSAEQVYHNQPSKLAAIESRWESVDAGESASWSILALPSKEAEKNTFELNVPHGLGYILEFKDKLSEPFLGLKEWKPEDRPPMIGLIFYSFRIMSGIGFFFVGLMLFSVIQWLRGKLSAENITQQPLLMLGWIFAAPLGYIAVEAGWIVREVGRQPWTVYGLIRTSDAASHLPASNVVGSLTAFAVVYTILFICALYFASRIIRSGPNFDLPVPRVKKPEDLDSKPAEFVPNQRPVEAQQ